MQHAIHAARPGDDLHLSKKGNLAKCISSSTTRFIMMPAILDRSRGARTQMCAPLYCVEQNNFLQNTKVQAKWAKGVKQLCDSIALEQNGP